MKTRSLILLGLLPVLFTGCYTVRSVSYTPAVYATTSASAPIVYATSVDMCQNLDLQAIAAAFAQSSNIREFEMLINNSSKYLNNIDINNDGYVDYIRVVESYQNGVHVFLLQATLGYNTYQDVATIVVENPTRTNWHIEIVGAPYIYGPNYVVRPVWYRRPAILAYFGTPTYVRWDSPWRWGSYPSYFRRQAPIVINNYNIRINNFMGSNRYCHEVNYVTNVHYNNYSTITRQYQRNDYSTQYPDRSFEHRTANIATTNSALSRAAAGQAAIRNANDLRTLQSTRTAVSASSSSRTSGTSTSASRTSGTSTSASRTSGTSTSASRTSGTSTSASRTSGTSTSASRTSGTSTSASRTSGTSTSASRTSGTSTSASRTSGTSTSASRTSGTSTSASRTSGTSTSASRTSGSTKSSATTASSTSGSRTSSSKSSATKSSTTKSSSSRSSATSGSRTSSSKSSATRSSSTKSSSGSRTSSSSSSKSSSSGSRSSKSSSSGSRTSSSRR